MLTQGMYKNLVAALLVAAGISDAELTRDIQRQISNLDYGSRRPVVSVKDGVVSVEGTVASLWLKEETINRILKVKGLQSIMSDLVIARAESDEKLSEEVGNKIRGYDLFTVYDSFDGRVKNGVVYLGGAVTEPKKLTDVVERVAKIKGVQAIENKVTVLPPSQQDDRLRVAVATAIYRLPEFERYSMADPPIHVIVQNSRVVLVGAVRAELEKRKALEAARFVEGSLGVEDRIQVLKK
jgi:osmotically-inducible protein OsmY